MTQLGRPAKYPYESMAVYDTFTILPGDKQPTFRSLKLYAARKGKELGRQFHVSNEEDGSLFVIRTA